MIALFLGNDVHDSYELAYGQEAHRAWRHPEPGTRRLIEDSAYPDVARMFFERLNHGRQGRVRTWLSERSALVRALAGSGLGEPDADAEWARQHPDEGFVLERADWQTVFHPPYRLAALDLGLARIEEGLRIAMRALREIAEQIEARQGTELLVVLLPTKERVYQEQIRRSGIAVPKSYDALVEDEDRIRAHLVAWMRDRSIPLVDALPALEAAARQDEPLFPQNADGHFLAPGYAVIASLVADALETD